MLVKADFHIHSCLSPCGDLKMSPSLIARTLRERGVSLAALTDHNCALNCPAFKVACEREGIAPLFGMEAQTSEEVHILCLFTNLKTALNFSAELYETLPNILNQPEKTGDQVFVNADDEILGEIEKYLVVSTAYDIYNLADRVHTLGGLVIPAHADRMAFSLTSQLGYIPDGDWDAIEMLRPPGQGEGSASPHRFEFPQKPVTQSSDAHFTDHIARRFSLLNIEDEPLLTENGETDIAAVRRALQRLLQNRG
jgi:PHP family Zn ribbon phosphoesterase